MSRFLSKLRGEKEKRDDLLPNSSSSLSSNNPYRHTQSEPPAYEPPPGPPPRHTTSSSKQSETSNNADPGDNPPPYHDWTSVPDTALLPPPPAIANDYSTTTNASYDEAAAAHVWCARHSVFTPSIPNVSLVEAIQAGQHDLDTPPNFTGSVTKISTTAHPASYTSNALGAIPSTVFHISSLPRPQPSTSRFRKPAPTTAPSVDQTVLTRLPLYFAATSSPLSPHFSQQKPHPHTIYFEIRPLTFTASESTVSIGFVSKPYPPNRQPGWHRASLAIHSDDGNRYVNDPWGGKEFTAPFRAGETLGLAVQILPEEVVGAGKGKTSSEREVRSMLPRCRTKVFFTRNGRVEGSWEVDEERDAEKDEGIAGLMGEVDLYAAVGMFGGVEVEVRFYEAGEGFVAPPPM